MKKNPDRELIALAAKAAGIPPPADAYEGAIDSTGAFIYYDDCEGKSWHAWNPLADDVSAMQLVVKLRLHLVAGSVFAEVLLPGLHGDYAGAALVERNGADPAAALRRAITRAAAEVGRSIP